MALTESLGKDWEEIECEKWDRKGASKCPLPNPFLISMTRWIILLFSKLVFPGEEDITRHTFFFASTYFFLRLGIIPKLSALDLTLKQEISPPRLFVILLNCSVERREVRLKLFIFIKVTILLMFAHLQSLSVLGIVIIPKNSVGSWHTLQYFWVPVWVAKYLKSNV